MHKGSVLKQLSIASAALAALTFLTPVSSTADTAAAASANVVAGDTKRGRKVYSRYCRGCHGVDGRGDGLVFMPHVNNLTKKGYIEALPDSYLMTAILKGGVAIGKSSYMPAWEGTLTEQDVADVIAHIRALPRY